MIQPMPSYIVNLRQFKHHRRSYLADSTIVNRELLTLHGGPIEITLPVT